MDIKTVLVADAVDEACIKLLEQHSIQVECKYKLPATKLIEEIKVGSRQTRINSSVLITIEISAISLSSLT